MTSASSLRGILAMTAGAGFLTLNDAVTKYLTIHYPIGQVMCLRQAAALMFILPYVYLVTGPRVLRVVNYWGQALRGGLFLLGAVIVVVSLEALPLSFVTVVLFSSPLFVAVISAPILGERVRSYQWIAIAVGFVGVMLIVRPGRAGAAWIALLPVLGACSNALRDVITRRLSRTESSISMLFWSGVIVTLAGLLTLPFGWKPLELETGVWFLAAGLANAAAHFMVIEAFRLGNAATVAPFRYSGLLWALLIGFLMWREVPDAWTLSGAGIVVCAGIYMLRQSTKG